MGKQHQCHVPVVHGDRILSYTGPHPDAAQHLLHHQVTSLMTGVETSGGRLGEHAVMLKARLHGSTLFKNVLPASAAGVCSTVEEGKIQIQRCRRPA